MINRPKVWLVCEGCGEFTVRDKLKEGDICGECNKAKLKLTCSKCGESLDDCACDKD
jgi:hypothetical protein